MKTDTIFYRLFQEFPTIFFELIGSSPEQAVGYEFTSQEVKQLAFRMDGLFLPTTNQTNQPFYLVEVQFQPDPSLYYRIFGELFLYLKQYRLPHPWQVVVIYPTRSVEREETLQFGEIINLNRVRRIYLDELGEEESASLGVGAVKLIIEKAETAEEKAKALVAQARRQLINEEIQRNLIDLIETIMVYKLPQKSREEIAAMFGLSDLKETRVYQEARLEGKLEGKLDNIPRMIQFGLSLEAIAQLLDLSLEVVQQAAQQSHTKSGL